MSPIFGAEVNLDIEAITTRLESAGLATPRLLRTVDGELWHTDPEGAVWRLMTHIEGHTVERADSAQRCHAAGQLLGHFHRALWRCEHSFCHQRLCVHDTAKHLAALQQALIDHRVHRMFTQVEPVAQRILEAAAAMTLPTDLPPRVVHGDPKITNVIFDEHGTAICLVDLDTLARMPLAVELGDALRSWCSPAGEEQQGPVQMDFLRAALRGYAAAVGPLPAPAERQAIPTMVRVIAVELAARFCADALSESYFGWDRRRFSSASEHNLVRARSQIYLAESLTSEMAGMERAIATSWGS